MPTALTYLPVPNSPPRPQPGLEEARARATADWGAALAFALLRTAEVQTRPLLLAAACPWLRERGEPFARGLAGIGLEPGRLVLVRAEREAEALWALEEALKSGAVGGAVAAADGCSFLMSKRIDFAARKGGATAVLVAMGGTADLSIARLRWRIAAEASAAHPFDRRAPGAWRISAELTRRRDGPLGAWILEHDDETHRLRLAAGLADHGLVQGGRTRAA